MANINTIKAMCWELTSVFKKTNTLKGLDYILKRYNGIDWKEYVKFCDEYHRVSLSNRIL